MSAKHAPSDLGPTLCGAQGEIAETVSEVTCKRCLSWPELVRHAFTRQRAGGRRVCGAWGCALSRGHEGGHR